MCSSDLTSWSRHRISYRSEAKSTWVCPFWPRHRDHLCWPNCILHLILLCSPSKYLQFKTSYSSLFQHFCRSLCTYSFYTKKICSVKLSHCFPSKKKPHIINATCSTHKKVFLKKLDKNPVMEILYTLCVKHQCYYYLVVVPF